MSYFKSKEYEVVPTTSLKIIQNCSGCGCKNIFINTKCFRINANGNCLDVWLIYQCKKCKHTYNIPLYERISPKRIKQEEYVKLLANDCELAFQYGTDIQLMKRNNAEINWEETEYKVIGEIFDNTWNVNEILIKNPVHLKIRTEKIISQIMGISRQELKRMVKDKEIHFEHKNLSVLTKIYLKT